MAKCHGKAVTVRVGDGPNFDLGELKSFHVDAPHDDQVVTTFLPPIKGTITGHWTDDGLGPDLFAAFSGACSTQVDWWPWGHHWFLPHFRQVGATVEREGVGGFEITGGEMQDLTRLEWYARAFSFAYRRLWMPVRLALGGKHAGN